MNLRPFSLSDLDGCLRIYRDNLTKDLIPENYEEDFVIDLEDPDSLSLVAELGDQLIGCGTICYFNSFKHANLTYGLIHPDFHRQGFGSQMLVARISLLTEADPNGCVAYLSATKNSVGFYQKVVGFGEHSRTGDEFGNEFIELQLPLSPRLIQSSINYIEESSASIQTGLKIPTKKQQQEY